MLRNYKLCDLAEFFKASKIKDIHISIKRISEGLKLKNRSGSESVKKEYPNHADLTNILAKDVPKSELRRLLSRLTGGIQLATLSEHELIVDLMLLESKLVISENSMMMNLFYSSMTIITQRW